MTALMTAATMVDKRVETKVVEMACVMVESRVLKMVDMKAV